MCLVHNVFIRILNCIYLQARNVKKEKDVADFVIFMHAWIVTIHEHHGNEERHFFPYLEKAIGVQGFMEKNVEQHHAFNPGLEKFEVYVNALREKKEKYDGEKVISLIDGFGTTLTTHLKDEIKTLEDLGQYEERINWKEWNKLLQDIALKTADLVSPFLTYGFPCRYLISWRTMRYRWWWRISMSRSRARTTKRSGHLSRGMPTSYFDGCIFQDIRVLGDSRAVILMETPRSWSFLISDYTNLCSHESFQFWACFTGRSYQWKCVAYMEETQDTWQLRGLSSNEVP